MNARLRALANQAGFQYIKDEGIGWAGNYNASLPKFAQLIVQECCDQFDKHPYVGTKRTQYIYGYIQGRVDAEQQIKKHFGVEE